MNTLVRSRPDDCLSDFVLDQWLSGDLEAAAKQRARAHLDSCSRCSQRLAAFEAVPVPELPASAPPAALPPPRRLWPAIVSASAALAVAAAVAFAVSRPGERRVQTIAEQGTRAKGSLALGVVARRANGETLRLMPGDVVAPGDRLRFELTSAEPGFVAVLGIDASGAVTPYAPYSGPMHSISPGPPFALPDAIEADATLGPERIVALRCPVSLPLGEIERAAQRALALAGADPRRVGALALDCAQTTFDIEKRATPKADP